MSTVYEHPQGMHGSYTVLTPSADGDAVELSRTLWRKKVLPVGTINYKGRKIIFDRPYLTDLAESFRASAFDQVPFMLTDALNTHTMDPERYRGEIKGMEVTDDGLYATVDLTPDAADLVRRNPRLGVSARIVEGYDRADGTRYERAMQHVLGTLDPRIPGLGAWEEVALARADDEQVLDLTSATYEGGPAVADTELKDKGDRRSRFLRWLMGDDDQVDEQGDAEVTDEELAELIAATTEVPDTAVTPPAAAPEPEPVGAALSNPAAPTAIDLAARAELDEQRTQLAAMRTTLAAERYTTERGEYVRKGVPPALVELARPLLESADPVTIDLSNGVDTRTVDAGAIARQMLDSMAGYIDLARERGHAFAPEADEDAEAENAKVDDAVAAYKKSFGI